MSVVPYLDGRILLHAADCRDAIATLPDASLDSIVTDPPYALVSIVKRFGGPNAAPAKSEGASGVYKRASVGFMGQQWDTGEVAFDPGFWVQALRVLKPGGHLVAASGTRTYHRLACAIEDAGFEIRDMVSWLYGSGFPKSHDVSKGIDRAAGAERAVVGSEKVRDIRNGGGRKRGEGIHPAELAGPTYIDRPVTAAASEAAKEWQGWGTALKPACKPFVLARKPLAGTVAANVLAHGTGALNIDGCRVETDDGDDRSRPPRTPNEILGGGKGTNLTASEHNSLGRWPANVVHDGSEEVLCGFPDTAKASAKARNNGAFASVAKNPERARVSFGHDDKGGSAARFFYSAKADADDRLGSKHPTVKPVDLMRWLCRLVTPPGGTVLDPFAGTGTTGEAAFREGFRAVLIEREATFCADIDRRMALLLAGPDERRRRRVAAQGRTQSAGPLFGPEPERSALTPLSPPKGEGDAATESAAGFGGETA